MNRYPYHYYWFRKLQGRKIIQSKVKRKDERERENQRELSLSNRERVAERKSEREWEI